MSHNPYIITIDVTQDASGTWVVELVDDSLPEAHSAGDLMIINEFDTEAEAIACAAMLMEAMRNTVLA